MVTHHPMSLKSKHTPLIILLALSLLIGIFTFQDYGMTWDEELYYQYGEAIGYAYSIPERLSGNYDLNLAYGPSAGDHRNRGPVYLLVMRVPVNALHALTKIDKVGDSENTNAVTSHYKVILKFENNKKNGKRKRFKRGDTTSSRAYKK